MVRGTLKQDLTHGFRQLVPRQIALPFACYGYEPCKADGEIDMPRDQSMLSQLRVDASLSRLVALIRCIPSWAALEKHGILAISLGLSRKVSTAAQGSTWKGTLSLLKRQGCGRSWNTEWPETWI